MRISDWSSDVCSSDLPPYSSRQKVPESFLRRSLSRRKSSSSLPPSTSQVSWRTRALLRKYWCPVGSQVQALGPFISQMIFVATFTTETLSGHCGVRHGPLRPERSGRSEAHKSELQSLLVISYAVF